MEDIQHTWQDFCDDLGPSKVLLINDPLVGLRGVAVVDNTACGPAIGGTRMAPGIGVTEVFRLARAMTFKNAAAGLPHGGCKSGIDADPAMDPVEKERLMRAFGRAIEGITELIPGPDMGTDETCMAYLQDEIGRSVGLPSTIGGIPLDEIGATGFGLAACAEIAQDFCDLKLSKARIAIQGFGAVGRHAARFLVERGARVVAVSDSQGGIYNEAGLALEDLLAHKAGGSSVASFGAGERLTEAELIAAECDIWIPAARPDVLREENVADLKARLVISGANIPATAEAERMLHERGVLVVPDYIANAGGVICAAVEYAGGTETQAFAAIEEKIAANTREVLERSAKEDALPRQAADAMALDRVREAMTYRRRGLSSPPGSNPVDL